MWALGAFAAAFLVWLRSPNKGPKGPAFSFAEITYSETAARYNVDNRPPAHLLARVEKLAIVAGHARAIGLRVTGGYRTAWVNGLVIAGGDGDSSPDVAPMGGDHPAALGLDVADTSPTTDNARLVNVKLRILQDPFLRDVVREAIVHGNHVHVSLDQEKLERL